MANNSFHDWKDDSDSPLINILLGALILVIVLGVGAAIYLNQDAIFGGDDGGDKTAQADAVDDEVDEDEAAASDPAEADESEDENVDEAAPADDEDVVVDEAEDIPANNEDEEDTAARFTSEDSDSELDDVADEEDIEADEVTDDDIVDDSAAEEDEAIVEEEDDDFAPSGNVNMIENVPMRDILSIYARPEPTVKLYSVLENFAPHAAGRYENWVYVYYFYSEVVMADDGETVLNRNNILRDGWVARGRLQLSDAQFNSLRVLNPDNLPALPNIAYTEETALPFLGLREVTSAEPEVIEDTSTGNENEEETTP